jgi:riboflavin synthase
MFTGIIEEVGTVKGIEHLPEGGAQLQVRAPVLASSLAVSDSFAINGTCLTVTHVKDEAVSFDAVQETLGRTNLGDLQPGSPVNLERPLTPQSRLGGHFVQGHIDTTAIIESIEPSGNARIIRFRLTDPFFARYIVSKGSIAVDGISLTVVDTEDDWFTVWVIPFTWEHTNFHLRQPNDRVNIETDLLARYVEKLMSINAGVGR